MDMNKFQIGDKVQSKVTYKGYNFPSIVVSIFITSKRVLRCVIEIDGGDHDGICHIMDPEQLELRDTTSLVGSN